jgi:hypothetical protein
LNRERSAPCRCVVGILVPRHQIDRRAAPGLDNNARDFDLTAQSGGCGVVACSQEEQHISLTFGQRTINNSHGRKLPIATRLYAVVGGHLRTLAHGTGMTHGG